MPPPSLLLAGVLATITCATAVSNPELDLQRRDLTDILDRVQDGINVEDITQGVLPDFFDAIPTPDRIKKQLGISDGAIENLPLEVLNVPGYANWSDGHWNLRIHAQAYKQPFLNDNSTSIVTTTVLDEAANVFLPDLDISELEPHEQQNARNLTSAILSLPQEDVQLDFLLKVQKNENFSDWTGRVVWPHLTDSRGEIDGFVPIPYVPPNADDPWLPDGSQTTDIISLDITTNASDTGNSTGYLVPPEGVLVLSDIDDILRVTKIYVPKEGLLNTFARDFEPWLNMPDIFAEWSTQHQEQPYHFHYLTTTPQQATRVYMDFIYAHYPLGSFDTRPMNFTTVDQTFSVRKTLLTKILQTFPQRRFVLIGDTTNPDVLSDYPAMARDFDNVHCILLRNTSATDDDNKFPYDTSGFAGLDETSYMFFRTPDDLAGLNFGNGDCVNSSVPQGVTFGWQNLPLGIDDQGSGLDNGGSGGKAGVEKVWWVVSITVCVVSLMMY